ncbi:uncharacterized protein [Oscarella lobularis]|uniref:uncharacterized protein n=1 Tax=Oscarella lobularis TaxID=121494 RepID=UPI0033140DCF
MEASKSTSGPVKPTTDDGVVLPPVVLPSGIYKLLPKLQPKDTKRYLAWESPGTVKGNGTDPTSSLCQWIVLQIRTNSWMRTLFNSRPPPEVNPWLKIDSDQLLTAGTPRGDPNCDFNVKLASPDVRFESDIYRGEYIGVSESGQILPPKKAGEKAQTSTFTSITVKKFVRSEQDFDMKKSQFVSKMNGKALSVQSKGKVILVEPKPHDETTHFKVLKTGDNVFIFQSVPFPSFNVRGNPDDTLDSDEKGTSFAIMETDEPGSYALFAPVYLKFMCVKNESEMEMNINPLPPEGDSTPLASGPGFFEIVILP